MALLQETERANKAMHDEYPRTASEYKCDWEQELERRERLGVTGPEPLPHADDIIVDLKNARIVIQGPATKEDKAEWDRLWNRIEECDRSIEQNTEKLRKPENKRYLDLIRDDIERERCLRNTLTDAVGEPKRRRPAAISRDTAPTRQFSSQRQTVDRC